MVTITVFVEGGGDGNALRTRCREGFRTFFEKAGLIERMPSIVACGSRQNAYDDFCWALKDAHSNSFPVLLVDSEKAVTSSPWTHLHGSDGWKRPKGAKDQQVHLMVQIMESWFLADRQCLARHFGKGFRDSALPNDARIESIAQELVFDSLKNATRKSQAKAYDKGKHSFAILGKIDPHLVRAASPHADRLVEFLVNPQR